MIRVDQGDEANMCGRLMLESDVTEIPRRFNLPFKDSAAWSSFGAKSDTSPGVKIPVVYPDRIETTLWGWWFWQKNKVGKDVKRLVINTREDTILEKLSLTDKRYSEAISAHRVLIPTNGFYEWPNKQRTLFTIENEHLFALGGLVFKSKNQDGSIVDCVSIITVPPNDQMKQYHDRMPMYVPESKYDEWLRGSLNFPKLKEYFHPEVKYLVI